MRANHTKVGAYRSAGAIKQYLIGENWRLNCATSLRIITLHFRAVLQLLSMRLDETLEAWFLL